jgi:Xaa-Pro aminopeptidase
MKYHQIDRDLFIKKNKFMAQMKQKCCRFNSNDIYPGADSTMPFEQSRDIFYAAWIRKKAFYYYFGRSL